MSLTKKQTTLSNNPVSSEVTNVNINIRSKEQKDEEEEEEEKSN